jgi:hypothetical protein
VATSALRGTAQAVSAGASRVVSWSYKPALWTAAELASERQFLLIYIYIYIYNILYVICIYVYMYIYMYVCVHVCMCVCMCMYVYVYIYKYNLLALPVQKCKSTDSAKGAAS